LGEVVAATSKVLLAAAVAGLAISVPISVAPLIRGNREVTTAVKSAPTTATSQSPSQHRAESSVARSLATPSQSPLPRRAAASTTPTPAVASVTKAPEGTVVTAVWHDMAATNTCVSVQVVYDNRSDTAVDTIRQDFQTLYTPKHGAAQFPSEVDGPIETVSQQVGIPPFAQKTI